MRERECFSCVISFSLGFVVIWRGLRLGRRRAVLVFADVKTCDLNDL